MTSPTGGSFLELERRLEERALPTPPVPIVRSLTIISVLFPALGAFLFGLDIAIVYVSRRQATVHFHGQDGLIELQSTAVSLGVTLTALLLAFVRPSVPRRRLLALSGIFSLLGNIASTTAPSALVLLLSRLLLIGPACGVALSSFPIYISEMSPRTHRGLFLALTEVFVAFGILFGAGIGLAGVCGAEITETNPANYTRCRLEMHIPGAFCALAMVLGNWFLLPDPPRHLVLQSIRTGDLRLIDAARAVLCRLCREIDVDSELLSLVRHARRLIGRRSAGFNSSLMQDIIRASPTILVGVGLCLFQQMSGQVSVVDQLYRFLELRGWWTKARIFAALAVAKVTSSVLAAALIERIGRKKALFVGLTLQGVSLAALGAVESVHPGKVSAPLALSLASLVVGGYQLSFGVVTWVLLGEVFPLRVRTRILPACVAINFAAMAAMGAAFTPLTSTKLGVGGLWIINALIVILAIGFVARFVHESKGKTLEQIEAMYLTGFVADPLLDDRMTRGLESDERVTPLLVFK